MPETKTLSFTGEVGFPTELYFNLIDILEKRGYEVRKKDDWLEVNPQSDYYQDMVQKKQNIQRQVGAVTDKLSDLRKQLEMLRHDKRKLDRIIEHKEEDDLQTLKSDFVDLVDSNTEMSLQNLANSGRFPSILVDFYKVESEEDIEDLEVSEAEKGVLRRKWELFQDWLNRYVSEIRKREEMIKSEIENKKASIDYYKEMLHPYAKAMRKISLQEPKEYQGLNDPRMVERYSTSLAGVELYAWKEISTGESREVERPEQEKRAFYCFLDIEIKKRSIVESGREKETIKIDIDSELKNWKEIEKVEKELEREEKEILQSIGQIKGELFEEEMESLEEEEEGNETIKKIARPIGNALRKVIGMPRREEPVGSEKDILEDKIDEEVDEIYSRIKESAGALKLRKGG